MFADPAYGTDTECACTVTVAGASGDEYVIDSVFMKVVMPTDASTGCVIDPPWRPGKVNVIPPTAVGDMRDSPQNTDYDLASGDCPTDDYSGWHSGEIATWNGETIVPDGTSWDLRLQMGTADDDLSDCSWLSRDGLTLKIKGYSADAGPPPDPRGGGGASSSRVAGDSAADVIDIPQNPLGTDELDMACASGATATTGMQLVSFPWWGHPVPVGISGERQHLFSEISAVTVTDWQEADELDIAGADGTRVTLTRSSPSATLSGGIWPMGGVGWVTRSSTVTGEFRQPTLSVTHQCPTSFRTDRRLVDQAYALDLDTLDATIQAATGVTGLGEIMGIASRTDWPVLVIRVHPIINGPAADGHTHVLSLELQGSRVQVSLPMTATDLGRWDVDATGTDRQLQGHVARNPGKLTLDLTAGSVTTALGVLQLSPTTVDLPVYP